MRCLIDCRRALLALALAAMPALGQSAPVAAVAGSVRDLLGHPVKDARVIVDGSKIFATSDDSGRFDLRGLPAGKNGFTITKLGYAPVSFEATLIPDSMIVIAVRMHTVQTLNTVNIAAARTNAYLGKVGFTERQKLGVGTFLTPAHLDSLAPGMNTPAQFLRDVRGLDVRCDHADCAIRKRIAPDCMWLFIDGESHGTEQLDALGLTPSAIAAIEVYDHGAYVPVEFLGGRSPKAAGSPSADLNCGAIVVWTKSRVR